MAHKSFKRAQNLDPVWFTLPGEGDAEVRFDCVPEIPGGVVLAFADTMEGEEGGNAIAAVKELFNAAIIESQHEQFWTMTKAVGGIGLGMLIEIASWLAEEYTSRPTGQSLEAGQQGKSGSPSTGGALRAVTTYSKPEAVALTT